MYQRSLRRAVSRRALVRGAAVVGASAAGLPLLQGAAQNASPTASQPSMVAERASGEVRLTGFGDEIQQDIVRTVLEGFSATYPNIQVSYEPIAAEYLVKIQTDIAAGNVADVFMVQNEYAQDFMSRNVLLAVDD